MSLRQILKKDYSLSESEINVIAEVVTGISNAEAANNLYVTESAIKFHLTNIYRKMGFRPKGTTLPANTSKQSRPQLLARIDYLKQKIRNEKAERSH